MFSSFVSLRALSLLVLAVGQAQAVGLGGTCSWDDDCDGALQCIFERCAEPGGLGADCEGRFQDDQCTGGLVCLFEKCSNQAGATEACESDRQCEGALQCIFDECAEPGGLGADCEGRFDDDQCAGALQCIFDVCATPGEVGDPCIQDSECAGPLKCIFDVCATPGEAGAPCENDSDCVEDSNLFCNSNSICAERGSGDLGDPCTDTNLDCADPFVCRDSRCDREPCFSGHNIVEVQGKGNVLMSSLQIGDYVRVHGGEYALVYSFGHYDSKAKTDFLQIYTGKHPPLEVSAEHLVYVGDKATMNVPRIAAAAKVKVGDYLLSQSGSSQQVISIRKVQHHGYFAPHTTTGDIVVSGVVASNYAAINWWAVHLSDPVLHWLQHGAAVPPRLFCKMIGGCTGEKYDASTGYSPYNTILFRMYQFQEGLPWILRAAFISVLVAPAVVCTTLLGMLLSTPSVIFIPIHLAAALLGIFLVWKKDMVFKNKM